MAEQRGGFFGKIFGGLSKVFGPIVSGIGSAVSGIFGGAKKKATQVAHQAISHAKKAAVQAIQTGDVRGAAKGAMSNIAGDVKGAYKSTKGEATAAYSKTKGELAKAKASLLKHKKEASMQLQNLNAERLWPKQKLPRELTQLRNASNKLPGKNTSLCAVTHSGSGMGSKAGGVVSLLLGVDAVPVRHDDRAQPAVAHTPGERYQAMTTSTVLASVKSTLRNSNGKHISILIRFTLTLKSKSVSHTSISKSTVKRELLKPKRIPPKALLQCTRKELAYSKVT